MKKEFRYKHEFLSKHKEPFFLYKLEFAALIKDAKRMYRAATDEQKILPLLLFSEISCFSIIIVKKTKL